MTSKEEGFNPAQWRSQPWEVVNNPFQSKGVMGGTAFDKKLLMEIGLKICQTPEDFNMHPNLQKIFQARVNSIKTGDQIDFSTAEALAFATLLHEGYNIRISGQDVERGTFS